jgi:hypothetical protein
MAKNTIKVKKYADVIEELTATAVAITPGALLERTSAGLVQACTATTGAVLPMFALEDELQGKGIDDNYAVSAQIQCWIPGRGDMVYALLEDGEDVEIGEFMESAGNGKLQVLTTGQPIAVAVEAVDDSGSSGTDTGRIIVQIV